MMAGGGQDEARGVDFATVLDSTAGDPAPGKIRRVVIRGR
jgi:hypothetical protein